jgi:hypothetical protein
MPRFCLADWIVPPLIVPLLFAQGALAGELDCHAIESTVARLACYDVAFPPKALKPSAVESASRAAYKDPLIAEDARTAAKLKNICRGC